MESGRNRSRRVDLVAFQTINVEWSFTQEQYAEFRSFFNTDLENGSRSTTIEIFEVDEDLAFMGSTYNVEHTDGSYIVSAKMEYI